MVHFILFVVTDEYCFQHVIHEICGWTSAHLRHIVWSPMNIIPVRLYFFLSLWICGLLHAECIWRLRELNKCTSNSNKLIRRIFQCSTCDIVLVNSFNQMVKRLTVNTYQWISNAINIFIIYLICYSSYSFIYMGYSFLRFIYSTQSWFSAQYFSILWVVFKVNFK